MASTKFKPYTFDPIAELDIEVPRNKRNAAREEVASYLKEALLEFIGDGRSPVSGGVWRKNLTPDYLKEKRKESGVRFANLELSGEMLDSLTVEVKRGKVVIDLAKDQYDKAEGHITGQYGAGNMKKDYRRQFVPQGEEGFKRQIESNIKRILREYEE